MRLALVISSLVMGGAERVITHLATGWANQGVDVHLITLANPNTDFYSLPPSVNRIALNLMKDSANPLQAVGNNYKRIMMLREQFKQLKPHAVISFMDATNVLALLANMGLGIPTVISERTNPAKYRSDLGMIWDNLRRFTYPKAKAIVAVSRSTAKQISAMMPKSLVEVIPNPVFYHEQDQSSKSEPKAPTVITMGRLVPLKNFDLLIRSFAKCLDSQPEWKLNILGEGPQRGALESLIRELDLAQNIRLLGAVKEPAPILAQADIFALCSSFEGFSNSLVEAMACKLPIICTREAGGEIVINKGQGLLVPEGDLDALTKSLRLLMGDQALRERLGDSAQQSVNKYLLPNVINQWNELLAKVTDRPWPKLELCE